MVLLGLVACAETPSGVVPAEDTGSTTADAEGSVCRDADGWARQYGWNDPAVAVRVGISPTRDHRQVFAVRVGPTLWLTDASPTGEGGTLVTPVNRAARILATEIGVVGRAGDSPWARLVPEARAAIGACGG